MKTRFDAIIQPEQAKYLDQLIEQKDDLLLEMEAFARENRVPIADREVASFLEITTRAVQPKAVLEIGMAIGYSVVHIARALPPDGLIVSIEPDNEMIRQTERFTKKAGVREKLRIEKGYALDVLPRISETFDILYLDAVKEEYSQYLEQALPKLRVGGLVICDNLLWGGQVAGEIRNPNDEKSTIALREFNKKFMSHPKLRSVILSVGDGLGYGIKIGN